MLTWPHPGTGWAPILAQTFQVFAQIASAISRDEIVLNVCGNPRQQETIAELLETSGAHRERLRFALADSDDTWARDHAPISTVTGDSVQLNDFAFDGWGGKYPARRDTRINRKLDRQGIFGKAEMYTHQLVLEGGAIETDGLGTLLATRSSVLDRARNPRMTDREIELLLREVLGIRRFLWLDHGELSGDDTDAHIDILARFTDPHTIVYSSAPADDQDHQALNAMCQQLCSFRNADGNPYRLRELPFPGILRDEDGRRLPAGYANFLVTNQSVLVPVYGVPADTQAMILLGDCFPGRRVVPIDCRTLVQQNGSLHCLTMQLPAAVHIHNAVEAVA